MPTTTTTLTTNGRTLQASTSNAAGATQTGTAQDISTTFGGVVQMLVTNGATGPTVGCDAIVEASTDGTNWYEYYRATASPANSAPTPFSVFCPPGVRNVRPKFTGNTGQAVTVVAVFHEATNMVNT